MAVDTLEMGKPSFFDQVYEQQVSAHRRMVINLLREPSEVDAALNMAMFTLWRILPGIDSSQTVVPPKLAYTIFYREAINQFRENIRYFRNYLPMLEGAENIFTNREANPEEEAEREQTGVLVRTALNKLPECQKTAIELKYYGGISNVEIAKTLEIAESSVSTLIHRGLAKLRNMLTPVFEASSNPQALTIDEADYNPEDHNPYLKALAQNLGYDGSDIFYSETALTAGISPVWEKLLCATQAPNERVYSLLMRKLVKNDPINQPRELTEEEPQPSVRKIVEPVERIFPPDALESGSTREFQTLITRLASPDNMPIGKFFKQAEKLIGPSPIGGLSPKRNVKKPQDWK